MTKEKRRKQEKDKIEQEGRGRKVVTQKTISNQAQQRICMPQLHPQLSPLSRRRLPTFTLLLHLPLLHISLSSFLSSTHGRSVVGLKFRKRYNERFCAAVARARIFLQTRNVRELEDESREEEEKKKREEKKERNKETASEWW